MRINFLWVVAIGGLSVAGLWAAVGLQAKDAPVSTTASP